MIFLVFFTFGIIGVCIKLYNPVIGFCFIGSFPPGCELTPDSPPCERFPPQTMGLLYEIFAQMWVQAFFVIVYGAQFAIWRTIRHRERLLQSTRSSIPGSPASGGDAITRQKLNVQREVAIQCSLYVVSFTLCWIGPTAFHLIGWIAKYQSFHFILILVIFTPLQGFWNCIVFARPKYVRLRKREQQLTRWEAIKMVFSGEKGTASTYGTGGNTRGATGGATNGGTSNVGTSTKGAASGRAASVEVDGEV